MNINLLDVVYGLIEQNGEPMNTEQIKSDVTLLFQDQLGQLDTMLSLDQRFCRTASGDWEKNPFVERTVSAIDMIQQAHNLEEQAIHQLTQDKADLEARRDDIKLQMQAIEQQLIRLGSGVPTTKVGQIIRS